MQWQRGDVFDQGNRLRIFDQVGGDKIVLASRAAFDAEMGELSGGNVDGEFLEALFLAARAEDPW